MAHPRRDDRRTTGRLNPPEHEKGPAGTRSHRAQHQEHLMHSQQPNATDSHTATTQPTAKEIKRLGKMISGSTWFIAAIVITFSVISATKFVAAHGTTMLAAPLIGLAVDAAFVMSLNVDATLARYGLPDPGMWPRLLRWFTGACSIYLNDGFSVSERDFIAVAIHTIAPALLLLLSDAGPAYRRALAVSQHSAEQATEVTESDVTPDILETFMTEVRDYLAAAAAPVEVAVNVEPVNVEPVTDDDEDEDSDGTFDSSIDWTAKPDADEAKKIIEQGWKAGDTVTGVARLVQRDKSYVSRRFSKLTEIYGPRSTVGV